MKTLLPMGETMACMVPDADGPLRYVDHYRMTMAGAESNLAIDAAKLEIPTRWFSRLGQDEFGVMIRNRIRGEGVDCEAVIFDETRPTGLMCKQTGSGESRVFYYRTGSAAAAMSETDIAPELWHDVGVLHLTGITPVLSESCRRAVEKAFDEAERRKIPISFDPNIRRKLWGQQDYKPLLRALSLRSTLLLMGAEEAEALFGTREPARIADAVFSNGAVQAIALKDGARGSIILLRGVAPIPIAPWSCHCVEPIGAGDAFNAGFLAGWIQGRDWAICGRMGAIAGAMATETPGDIEGAPTRQQMEKALQGAAEIYR